VSLFFNDVRDGVRALRDHGYPIERLGLICHGAGGELTRYLYGRGAGVGRGLGVPTTRTVGNLNLPMRVCQLKLLVLA